MTRVLFMWIEEFGLTVKQCCFQLSRIEHLRANDGPRDVLYFIMVHCDIELNVDVTMCTNLTDPSVISPKLRKFPEQFGPFLRPGKKKRE